MLQTNKQTWVLWQSWCFHAHQVPSLTGIQLNIYLRKCMWGISCVVFWPKQFYLHQNCAFAFSNLDVTTSSVPRKWCSHFLALSSSFECIEILDFFGFIIIANLSILLISVFTPSTANLANIIKVKCQFYFHLPRAEMLRIGTLVTLPRQFHWLQESLLLVLHQEFMNISCLMISKQAVYPSNASFFYLLSSTFIHRIFLFQHLRFC